jgi:phosphoenolpyruvate carboxylase
VAVNAVAEGDALERDIALLTGVLHVVVTASEGPGAVALMDDAVALARGVRAGEGDAADRLAELVACLDARAAATLVKALTRWFQLINLAEDSERVRRVRRREAAQAPAPRAGSLREAVSVLARRGMSAAQVGELLARSQLRLVMTAHPTEARRRTTIDKLARVFRELRDMDDTAATPRADAERRLLDTVQELWGSDDLRAVTLTVLDEVRGGLLHFSASLAQTVPRIYRDLEDALTEYYPDDEIAVPPLLSFGSWIGGDRDGNPLVTPDQTVAALELMRQQCLRLLEGRVELLAGRLSFSSRLIGHAPELEPILSAGEDTFPELAGQLAELNPEEPFRRALTFIRERLRAAPSGPPAAYRGPEELLGDLRLIESALDRLGLKFTAGADLHDVIRQVEVFGFHFATLDIREHAAVHRRSLHEIFADLGMAADYSGLAEEERIELLRSCIADHRPIVPADIAAFSAGTRETIETFRMLRAALNGFHPGTIQSYIVSNTTGPADLLEVLLLMKEASLTKAGGAQACLRIVPLFEARSTLVAAAATMDRLLSVPEYRAALRAVGDEQEVMLGYSDSNKDAGYVASGWGAYQAQVKVAAAIAAHGASCIFFHGRGGAVGRGGGPTNRAIMALAPGTVEGRLKMTEQGEVLTAKYASAEIAHRELELALSATLLSGGGAPVSARHQAVLQEMADDSAALYRATVYDDEAFVRFFAAATPIAEVSRQRLGSRPARRRPDGGIDDLRAIPWVFSWTQSRILLPAWFGIGTALRSARERHGIELLHEMTVQWPFFATLLANAEMGLAKAEGTIGRRYAELWSEQATRERIWRELAREFELARSEMLLVRGYGRLLDSEPVLQASIDRRNPFVDPLSFVQIELLRRLRGALPDDEREALARVSLLTINGIASGLRNTG